MAGGRPGGRSSERAPASASCPSCSSAPAGKAFQVVFESQTGDPHNIAISLGGADPVFRSDVFNGPGSKTYQVAALATGTYAFKGDVHPGMSGTLTAK